MSPFSPLLRARLHLSGVQSPHVVPVRVHGAVSQKPHHGDVHEQHEAGAEAAQVVELRVGLQEPQGRDHGEAAVEQLPLSEVQQTQ